MKQETDPAPIYRLIAEKLKAQIISGVFVIGDKLPSIRQISFSERVSLNTVIQALSLMEAEGWLEAIPKAGHFVKSINPKRQPTPSEQNVDPAHASIVGVSDLVAEVFRQVDSENKAPLGAGFPAAQLLPLDRISVFLAQAIRNHPELLGTYGDPSGQPEFKRQLARRLAAHGWQLDTQEIIATSGAMESLNLAFRAVTKPGDTVAIQEPCYFGILEIMESLGLRAVLISCDCSGPNFDRFKDAIIKNHVAAVAWIPSFNNPNGSCLNEDQRKEMLSLVQSLDIPLIEDDVYGELYYGVGRPRAVKSFDRSGHVIYCGSYSKCIAPGLRVGWISAGRYTERIQRLKFISTMSVSAASQLALARYIEAGAMDRRLRSLRKALQQQILQGANLVRATFPINTQIEKTDGGFFIWVELPNHIDALELHRQASRAGIHIVPGQVFSPHGAFNNYIRLSFAHPINDYIKTSIEKLGMIARQIK